jgi:hypothetical protein
MRKMYIKSNQILKPKASKKAKLEKMKDVKKVVLNVWEVLK